MSGVSQVDPDLTLEFVTGLALDRASRWARTTVCVMQAYGARLDSTVALMTREASRAEL